MPERLLLRISADGSWSWLFHAKDRPPAASTRGLPPPTILARAREVVLLVPAGDVLLAGTSLKVRSRGQLEQALPYALEERIVGAVEEHHFAPGEVDGMQGAAVVARQRLDEWLRQLGEADIAADVVLPESLALPWTADSVRVMLDDEGAVVRHGNWSAFACPPAQLSQWLGLCLGGRDMPIHVDDLRSQPGELALPGDVTLVRHAPDRLRRLAGNLSGIPLNLLSNTYAPSHRHGDSLRWWRRAGGLAAVALLLAFVGLGVEVLQMTRSAMRLDTAMADVVRRALPEVPAQQLLAMGPRRVIDSYLGPGDASQSADGLLAMLGAVAPVLGGTTRVQTRAMEFRAGTLELALRAPDVATLDGMRERLAASGLQAEVIAAHAEQDHVDGRIRIRGGQP